MCTWFKDGDIMTVALAWHHAGPTHQSRRQVIYNAPVQIRCHHHVKLVGVRHQLQIIRQPVYAALAS